MPISKKRRRRNIQYTSQPDPDLAVLSVMKRHNADLSQLQPVWFYLYFDSEAQSINAKHEFLQKGYEVELSNDATPMGYCCLVTSTIAMNGGELKRMRNQLSLIALKYGGIIDGWETEMKF